MDTSMILMMGAAAGDTAAALFGSITVIGSVVAAAGLAAATYLDHRAR